MTVQEGIAQLSNGAHLTYLDTGAPEGETNYRTFVFIPGAAHNKCIFPSSNCQLTPDTFEPVLDITPKNVRAISYSLRGYNGSTPLSPEEAECKVTPSQLHKTHVSDFAAFIEYLGTTLKVPPRSADGTAGLTTVHWSKGGAIATGLFYFQSSNPKYKSLIDKYISSVILYEPPISNVYGMDPGDCANGLFYHRLNPPPEDPGFMFAKYVTGFYRHSPEYKKNKGGQEVLQYYRSGALEQDFQGYSKKVFEGTYIARILHWYLTDDVSERYEAAHEAFKEMAGSSVKKIGLLYGSDGPPEGVEGCWIGEKWLEEEAKKTGEEKLVVKEFPGGNHYIQFYDPKGFWDYILQMSV